ncbi:MAG: hypothetical protein AB1668_05905 [Nanoarchaeota archaeon]
MLTNTGAKMDGKEILLRYLNEKSNEEEVIAFLQEQKKLLANPKNSSAILSDDYVKLLVKLAKNSKEKVKYHTLIILSNVEVCIKAMNFYELCQIAAESSKNKDGNIRQASYILIKSLNAIMIMLPIIHEMQKASNQEVNLFYESFRKLFYQLYFRVYNSSEESIKKSALKSLGIMLPKFYDMAKFWKDKEEIEMADKIKEELNKYGIRN